MRLRTVNLEALANAGPESTFEPARATAPSGWDPGVRYDPAGAMQVTTPMLAALSGEDEWAEAIGSLGITVPEGWRIRLVEAKYDPAAWHRDAQGDDAVTRPVWRYRFAVEPSPASVPVDDLLAAIGRARPKPKNVWDLPLAYVVLTGDLQLGKVDGDGTTGTIARFMDKTHAAVTRLKDLRRLGHKPDRIVLAWLGDCIEGNQSQGGTLAQAGRIDLTITEQVRVLRRLMLEQIKLFAGLAPQIVVPVVPGNHDEAERIGKTVRRYDDSWAIDAASAVADALALAGGFEHVGFVFPGRDELTVTLDVAGTPVGFAHGHQFGRDPVKWWSGQSHGMQPIGSATLLCGAHLHHLRIQQTGAKTFIQIPALDGGSTWFRHRQGEDAPPGLVTLLVDGAGWRDLAVL